MDRRVGVLPQDESGDMRGCHCHQQKTEPNNWHIPPALYLGALNVIRGGPDTLPGPRYHSVRGTQRQHWPIPEPAQTIDL